MPPETRDISELLFLLSSNDTQVRIAAVKELGKTSSLDAYGALKQILMQRVPALKLHIKQALSDIQGRIRESNAELYEKFFVDGEDGSNTSAGLSDEKERENKKVDYDILAGYLDNEDPASRIAAIQACGTFSRDPKLESLLTDRLGREEHPFAIATILINLGRCGSPGVRDIIADFLSRPDDRIRANAVEGLEYLADSSVLPLLIPLAGDSSPRVRANVAKALAGFDPGLVKTTLVSMIESGDDSQAEAARFVIELTRFNLKDGRAPVSEKKIDPAQARAVISSSSASGEGVRYLLPAALIAAVMIVASFFIYRSFYSQDVSASEPVQTVSVQEKSASNSYETELTQKTRKIAEECERLIFAGKLTDAKIFQIKLAQANQRDPLVRILDGEIMIAQKDFRGALESFKNALRADGDNPRVHYGLGLCYLNLGNSEEAVKFFEVSAGNDRTGKYKSQALKLVSEIRSKYNVENDKARSDASAFFESLASILNNEGPKAIKQYYRDKNAYETFEQNWRTLLLEVKRWRCSFEPVDIRLTSRAGMPRVVEARVLSTWHYTNYGGNSWIIKFYDLYTLGDIEKDYSFDSDSVALPFFISGVSGIAAADYVPSDVERNCSAEVMMACAHAAACKSATAELEIWRKIYREDPSNAIAAMEIVNKSIVGDTAEAAAVIEAALRVPPEKYPFQFAFGNTFIRSTLLSIFSSHFLRLDDGASYARMLETIVRENPDFAQAHFELAIRHQKNGAAELFRKSCAAVLEKEPDYPAFDFYFFGDVYNDNLYAMKSAEVSIGKDLIGFFEGTLAKKPDYWRTYYNLGRIFILKEDYASARKFFESALKLSPKNVTVLSRLVFCCIRQKDMKNAREYHQLAEKTDPDNFQVRRNRKLLAK